jgi:transposase
MHKIDIVGLDLAKNIFQVHAIAADGAVVVKRQVRRSQMLSVFARLPPCLMGMEACGGAHHWAREIKALGHEVRLMPPADVKPYVKRGKMDAGDAEAICEAAADRPCCGMSARVHLPRPGSRPCWSGVQPRSRPSHSRTRWHALSGRFS